MATEASAVLTEESTVTCGHQGSVTPTGIARLKVNGHPVLVKASLTGKSVSSCILTNATDSGGVLSQQCKTVSEVTSQSAGKLKVRIPDGITGVLTDPLTGTTDGIEGHKPAADLNAKPVQTRLKAV